MNVVTLTDPAPLLVEHESEAAASMINEARSECGVILQSIDWITRQLGFDLIGAIFDPIAGDFDTVDAMRQDWLGVAGALKHLGANYEAMAAAIPSVWDADSSRLALERLRSMGGAHARQAEAAELMSEEIGNMLEAVKLACSALAAGLSLLEQLILSLSAAKWVEEIATMGGGVRKAVAAIHEILELVEKLPAVLPPLFKAASIMAQMFQYTNELFTLPLAVNAQAQAAGQVEDTARAGFHSTAFDHAYAF